MIPIDLIKQITKSAHDSKHSNTSDIEMTGKARKAAVRKLMTAIKDDNDESFLEAFDEFKTISETD